MKCKEHPKYTGTAHPVERCIACDIIYIRCLYEQAITLCCALGTLPPGMLQSASTLKASDIATQLDIWSKTLMKYQK